MDVYGTCLNFNMSYAKLLIFSFQTYSSFCFLYLVYVSLIFLLTEAKYLEVVLDSLPFFTPYFHLIGEFLSLFYLFIFFLIYLFYFFSSIQYIG